MPQIGPSGPAPLTYRQWFTSLLAELGIPATEGNLEALADVVHEEGPNSYWNPFNIESHGNNAWKGSGNFNSVGVQEYSSAESGLKATAAFLTQNSGWSNVINALRSGDKSTVDQALTDVYTWAPFHTTSAAGAQNILNSKMGGVEGATPPGSDSTASSANTGPNPSTAVENVNVFASGKVKAQGISFWGTITHDLGTIISGASKATGLDALSRSVSDIGAGFTKFFHDVEWLFKPSNELRILSGAAGIVALIVGVYMIATSN